MSILLRFLFPPPASVAVTAVTVSSFVGLTMSGISEVRGKHLQYSKFWNAGGSDSKKTPIKLSGRTGMLAAYTPAFLASLASFFLIPLQPLRFVFLNSALAIHFFKRIFEVIFVHKYSGPMILDSVIPISISYFTATAGMIYAQYLTRGLPEPPVDLKYAGIALFVAGISGNFYHHYLLSKLRKKGEKEYKIPKGGLFDVVICPHYLFEIMGFIGVSCISQTVYAFSFTLGTTFYLMGRSYVTRKWYLSKFEDFPKDVKALIPYVF